MSFRVPNRDFTYTVSRVVRVGDLQLDQTEFGPATPPVPRHFHQRGVIALVVRGHVLDHSRGRRVTLVPGSVLCLPPGEAHTVSVLTPTARVFSLEVGSGWLANALGGTGEFPVDQLRAQEMWVTRAAARLYRAFTVGHGHSAMELEESVLRLFGQPPGARVAAVRAAPRWLRRAMELVADRAHQPLRMRDVAAEVGVHPVTLSRSFRQIYGVTISAFLQRRRLDLARVALATSDVQVGSVAIAHGFSDHAHFTRTFRRVVGMAPSTYRAAVRQGGSRAGVPGASALRSGLGVVNLRASEANIFLT